MISISPALIPQIPAKSASNLTNFSQEAYEDKKRGSLEGLTVDEIKAQFQAQIETMLERGGQSSKAPGGNDNGGIRDIQRGTRNFLAQRKINQPSPEIGWPDMWLKVDIELQSKAVVLSLALKRSTSRVGEFYIRLSLRFSERKSSTTICSIFVAYFACLGTFGKSALVALCRQILFGGSHGGSETD